MNWVDVVILVLVVAAAAHGVARGAAVQVLTFAGIGAGLALGVALAPSLSMLVSGAIMKTLVSLFCVFGLAGIVGGAGEWLGIRALRRIYLLKLRPLDATLGAFIAVLSTLVAVWLIGGMLTAIPSPGPLAAVHDSKIIGALENHLPPPPSLFSRIGRILNQAGFPPVFAGIEPQLSPKVALPGDPTVRAAVAAAGASTVRVSGPGCGGITTGSGFVVAPDMVVTNAHVVAGVAHSAITDASGRHRATVVLFDPKLDIAILRTSDKLTDPPLTLRRTLAERGTVGAVLGYPGGGPFRAVPAAIRSEINALGRDIYSAGVTYRSIYQMDAEVHPGNSGGPFVRPSGEVDGVIFSVSVLNDQVSYALTSDEVAKRVDLASSRFSAVDTGPCPS